MGKSNDKISLTYKKGLPGYHRWLSCEDMSADVAYVGSFALYLGFLSAKKHINPDKIEMEHFSLPYLESFGEYLEQERLCCSSTINLRMSSIKSFLRYAAVEAPEYSDIIRKSLSLPCRKTDKPVMAFLKKEEYEAMLEICNDGSAVSLRDKMLLMVLYNTGCRVSELINVEVSDVFISHRALLRITT